MNYLEQIKQQIEETWQINVKEYVAAERSDLQRVGETTPLNQLSFVQLIGWFMSAAQEKGASDRPRIPDPWTTPGTDILDQIDFTATYEENKQALAETYSLHSEEEKFETEPSLDVDTLLEEADISAVGTPETNPNYEASVIYALQELTSRLKTAERGAGKVKLRVEEKEVWMSSDKVADMINDLNSKLANMPPPATPGPSEPRPLPNFGALRRREPSPEEAHELEILEETIEEAEDEEISKIGKVTEKEEATIPDHLPKEKASKKINVEPSHKTVKERESMSEGPTRKARRITRELRPSRPLTKFEGANTAIIRLYEDTLAVIEQGISAGKACGAVGLLSLLIYADFLHGGAYAAPINERPYHMKDPTKSPYYAGDIQMIDATHGFLGWLIAIFGVLNPGPLVQEIFLDANVPHVFPKLLSDDGYAAFLFVWAHLAGQDVMQKAGTNLTTMVEAGKKVVETAKQAIPSRDELKNMTALFKLMGA